MAKRTSNGSERVPAPRAAASAAARVEAGAPGPDASEPVTRERILAAALALVDEEGLAGVTMRRLAERLGVQAASLYNHVRSKEAILDAVADAVMERVDTTGFQTLPWRAALERWAWSYYEALVAHPNLVPHLAVAFGRLPTAIERAAQVYAGLRRAGWTPSRATRVAAAIRYAVYGAALGSFAGTFGEEAERHPELADVGRLRAQRERVDRAALRLLIDRFLDGVEELAPRDPAPPAG